MLLRALCLMFVGVLGSGRDWTAHPAVVERDAPETIYAIGDIHGDYDRLAKLLLAAKVVTPESMHWNAGSAVLVVTGDMIDKGPRPVDVIHILFRLRAEAPKAGGQVIFLAGNHEAQFLAGGDAKKNAELLEDMKRNHLSREEIQGVLGELPFAARVGDWFFSHGGNSAGRSIAQISQEIREGVTKDGYGAKVLSAPDSLIEARLGEGKAQWIGLTGQRALLQKYADALGVKHIVQGHQPGEVLFDDGARRKKGQIFSHWGLLYLIDVGMSSEIDDSKGAMLRIVRGQVDAVYPDGSHSPVPESN